MCLYINGGNHQVDFIKLRTQNFKNDGGVSNCTKFTHLMLKYNMKV